MIQNVECDITGHYEEFGETGKTLVYENDISKRDFGDFESYEELHEFGNETTFTGMVLDSLEKVTAELETALFSMENSHGHVRSPARHRARNSGRSSRPVGYSGYNLGHGHCGRSYPPR
jgi:hypothetical protein